MNTAYLLFKYLTPESFLAETAFFVLIAGLVKATATRRIMLLSLTLLGGLASIAWIGYHPENINICHGMAVIDPLTRFIKIVIVGMSLVACVYAATSAIREHLAEYLALILFSTIGMMLLVSAEDLLMIFIGLEMTSIPLYLLTGYLKRSSASAEAALKYFLFGGVSAAFLLFGLSLIYGVTGLTSLQALAQIPRATAGDPLFLTGVALALAGFGFKVAAVPFHLWAPDVYEGAPTPSAALIASGSKVAGFLILAKFLTLGFVHATGSAVWNLWQPGWLPLLAVIAAASVVVGNLAALSQSNVKRILAYSAIAQSGYMLIGLLAASQRREIALASVLFYAIVYALTTLGAFGVVGIVEQRRGGAQLHHFDGLHESAPGLALAMGVFMISLAGIPPLAGFFGKFYLFAGALGSATFSDGSMGLLWVIVVAIVFNAVSLYYYLIVLKHVFVAPTPDAPSAAAPQPRTAAGYCAGLLAVAILGIGLYPPVLLNPLDTAIKAMARAAAQAEIRAATGATQP
ncbi:MAG: NADH-quinone oxidoreductase subunit N [Chthoniobacteraceae bacterium]|nr:NADH-quinone oxidoreductase subunit N [Chthoniobacteraceae bacterium]